MLQEKIKQLEKENQKLHNQLRKFLNENTPSGALSPYLKDELKQITTESAHEENSTESPRLASPNPRNRRKKPDRKEIHEMDSCPCCGGKLRKMKKVARRTVLHLKLPKVENILHESNTYRCDKCNKTFTAPVPDTLPKSKYDLNISLFVILLFAVGVTQRKTKEILSWFGVSISDASINNIIHRVQHYLGDRKYKELEERLKRSISCGVDETGYRYRGKAYWIWAVANAKTVFYSIEKDRKYHRAKNLPLSKIATCDGYRACDKTGVTIQRCWAHALRKARTPEFPFYSEDEIKQYKEFVEGLAAIYHDAKHTKERGKEVKERFDRRLRKFLSIPRKEERNLITAMNYLLKYDGEWFTFLERKGIEPTNNECERALRPLVIRRKISQHSWSLDGMKGLAITQSIYETCKLRNEDFMDFIRNEINSNLNVRGKS